MGGVKLRLGHGTLRLELPIVAVRVRRRFDRDKWSTICMLVHIHLSNEAN